VVLNLLLIGLGIAVVPFPLTAFVLVLAAQKGTWRATASTYCSAIRDDG
jgi:hypothetical protein